MRFDAVLPEKPGEDVRLEPFDLSVPPDIEPSQIDLSVTQPHTIPPQPAVHFDNAEQFEEAGGGQRVADTSQPQLGGQGIDFSTSAPGVASRGYGGLGSGTGETDFAGAGGAGSGLAGRGAGNREALLGRYGGTKATERAVAAALNWLARHQAADGSWSLDHFSRRCRDGFCNCPGSVNSDSAATALALLPFLAAGQTHQTKGLYQETIRKGLFWLIRHQDSTSGNLSAGSTHVMYSHGLATIVLCEAYGMTKDSRIGYAAQAAVEFIQKTQSSQLGGWRYLPGDFDSDTSVVGWQLMALKSAQMAGLQVNPATLEGVQRWLASVTSGHYGGYYAYKPGQAHTPTMTAVGLLCRQYLGAPRDSPALDEGAKYLMRRLPQARSQRNIYYVYYATQVMHNLLGEDWEKWNRHTRRILVESQVTRRGCSAGSWDPDKPASDAWGERGGRLMVTSLSCLTLEVYYRYLPLYDLEARR